MNLIGKISRIYYKYFNSYLLWKSDASFKNININGILYISNKGSLVIGDNFSANSGINHNPIGGDVLLRLIVYRQEAVLTIGDNVGISNSSIICWNKITIGNNVVMGGGVRVWDTNYHSLNPDIRVSGQDNDIKTAPIIIKDNAFIGGGSIILKGVTIGENSIIAAGSVVTKSIPSNVIAGGNPCRVIKNIDTI
jgi:acetyltransferase-like isoleucine patch superfamily enzyme